MMQVQFYKEIFTSGLHVVWVIIYPFFFYAFEVFCDYTLMVYHKSCDFYHSIEKYKKVYTMAKKTWHKNN